MSVIVHSKRKPYGILGAHTARPHVFNKNDINFVQAIANILANAIERKQAEEHLKESRIKYQDLYENAPDMLASVDKETSKYN